MMSPGTGALLGRTGAKKTLSGSGEFGDPAPVVLSKKATSRLVASTTWFGPTARMVSGRSAGTRGSKPMPLKLTLMSTDGTVRSSSSSKIGRTDAVGRRRGRGRSEWRVAAPGRSQEKRGKLSNMDVTPFRRGLRDNERAIVPGAQTERRGLAGPGES